MRLLEIIAICLIVMLILLVAVFGRREYFVRGHGTIELCFRLTTRVEGRGWSTGFAQFRGDELRWYRMFSLAPGPRRRLSRRTLTVLERRSPTPEEALLVPADWTVLHCKSEQEEVEIAMQPRTLTGFLSWLESARPFST